MSIQWNLIPSLLFCHSSFSGDGIDETSVVIVALDPNLNIGSNRILTLGTSGKNKQYCLTYNTIEITKKLDSSQKGSDLNDK